MVICFKAILVLMLLKVPAPCSKGLSSGDAIFPIWESNCYPTVDTMGLGGGWFMGIGGIMGSGSNQGGPCLDQSNHELVLLQTAARSTVKS